MICQLYKKSSQMPHTTQKNRPTVIMMGLGYIGLPTAALMAAKGLQVTGVDISSSVVETINRGEIHIIEPDLAGLVHQVVQRGNLRASTQVHSAEVYLIAVPTPFKGDYEPDLSYVESATRMVLPWLKPGQLLIIESTSPVGTTEQMQALIERERPELKGQIALAYCPERVLPGNVIQELEHNDRVIGGINEASTEKALAFYRLFVKGDLHRTTARTAEMCKLVENASRDVQIAFANELSMICAKADIDVWELIRLANRHPRVKILQPGTGVGGHCIAVDPWFIVSAFPQEAQLIRKAREINNYKTQWVIERIAQEVKRFEAAQGRRPVIACLGLAFKPNIDDLRESPALAVAQSLQAQYGEFVRLVEPHIAEHSRYTLTDFSQALAEADICCVLVAHQQFKGLKTEALCLDFCGALQ